MMHGCVVQATLFSLSAGRKNTERLSPGPSPYGNMPQPGKTRPPKKKRGGKQGSVRIRRSRKRRMRADVPAARQGALFPPPGKNFPKA